MKLSANTLATLSSFSRINPSIYIEKGNVIKTRPNLSSSPTAKKIVEEEFPVSFGIYELKKFLSIVSLFDSPDFEFEDKLVKISDKKSKAVYRFTAEDHISHPPYDKDYKFPSVDCSFTIDLSDIQTVINSAATLGQPDIAFIADKTNVYVSAYNSTIPERQREDADTFRINIGQTDKKFTMIFNIEDFIFIKDVYDVELCFKGIAKFESKNSNLTYWISPRDQSKYE